MSADTDTSSGGGFGSKIKGVAQIIHGFGESFRGSLLGSADRASGSKNGEKKHDDIATKGREEIAQGMAKVKGHPPQPVGTTQETSAGTEPGVAAGSQPGGPEATGEGQQKDKSEHTSTGEERSGWHSGHETTENRSEQKSEQPLQQRADVGEQRTTGQPHQEIPKQEVGQQDDQKGLQKDTGGRINFQGIPQDDGGAPS